jgi:hypothetical protein
MGDLELLELPPAGGGAISPRLLNSIMMNLVTHGPELSGDDDENRKLSIEWMESSFKSVVQQFLGEQLPSGVPVPDVLFEEMFGMLNLIRAIQFHRALHS